MARLSAPTRVKVGETDIGAGREDQPGRVLYRQGSGRGWPAATAS